MVATSSSFWRLCSTGNPRQLPRKNGVAFGRNRWEDGPTDAAGAMVDASSLIQAKALALDAAEYLRRSDAYRFFDACGGLIKTGPTHTNVCDVRVVWSTASNVHADVDFTGSDRPRAPPALPPLRRQARLARTSTACGRVWRGTGSLSLLLLAYWQAWPVAQQVSDLRFATYASPPEP